MATYGPNAGLDRFLTRLRQQYPDYVLLIKEGGWYEAYDQDASALHQACGFNVVTWCTTHTKTGGPVLDNIRSGLRSNGYSYVVLDNGRVLEKYDAPNPNAALYAAKSLPIDVVRYGSVVTAYVDGDKEVYTIVDTSQADPIHGKVSVDSLMGKAIVGRKLGESFSYDAPVGSVSVEIIGIDNSLCE